MWILVHKLSCISPLDLKKKIKLISISKPYLIGPLWNLSALLWESVPAHPRVMLLFWGHKKWHQGTCNCPYNYQGYPMTLSVWLLQLRQIFAAVIPPLESTVTLLMSPCQRLCSGPFGSPPSCIVTATKQAALLLSGSASPLLLSRSLGELLCTLGVHWFLYGFPRPSISVFKLQPVSPLPASFKT